MDWFGLLTFTPVCNRQRNIMTFDRNSYETPPKEADLMAKLVLPTDNYILEPFAGTGQLIKAMSNVNANIRANELSQERYSLLVKNNRHVGTIGFSNQDFFGSIYFDSLFDLIITNPPFDDAIKGIKHALPLLNDKPESRLLFLLPLPFFSSQKRSKEFKELDCHIAAQYMIPWRIDYLKDGKPMSQCQKEINGVLQFKEDGVTPIMNSGSQEYHAVFCIKKGKNPDSNINFLA